MTGPYTERIRVLEARLKDADRAHAKTLFDFHEMKARAETAEADLATETQMRKDQDRRLEKAEARADAAEKRIREIEAEFNAMTVQMRGVNVLRAMDACGPDCLLRKAMLGAAP